MVIITLLTQVRKEKNGKINLCPGIEPGTQRLGVLYTKHQAITQDKSLSPYFSLCTASGRWRICQPHTGSGSDGTRFGGSASARLADPPTTTGST